MGDKVKCKQCGRYMPKDKVNVRGVCYEHSMKNLRKCWEDMTKKRGFYYERWKVGMSRFAKDIGAD